MHGLCTQAHMDEGAQLRDRCITSEAAAEALRLAQTEAEEAKHAGKPPAGWPVSQAALARRPLPARRNACWPPVRLCSAMPLA